MQEWWDTKWAALASILLGLGGGGMVTYLLSPAIGIPISIILVVLGIVMLIRAYGTRNRLLGEARTKCKKGDHAWFNDRRLEDVAYIDEGTNKVDEFGNIKERYFTKTCKFCGHTESGLIF